MALCRALEVSRSGYDAWCRRASAKRQPEDAALAKRIASIHQLSRGTYGSPPILEELKAEGTRVSRKRVARLMRRLSLRGVSRRKYTRTTPRDGSARPAPDLVDRQFKADAPDRLWVADIT